MVQETVLSGIRATGRLHFGNFMGAVTHFVRYQRPGTRSMYFIADLHTLTTLRNPNELRGNVVEIAKDYIAAGLDPVQSIIYAQSSVPEIPELSLLLSMMQPLGELLRIPTFKEKVKTDPDSANLGFVTYPVLMAADILGPQTTLVPVGEDQRPNVELARNLAIRFNQAYDKPGDTPTFTIPEMMIEMIKIPGLDGGKMGKSEADNAIDINASIADIRLRYRRHAQTDIMRVRANDPGDPYNRCRSVYPLHELITEGERDTRVIANACLAGSIRCVDCKERLCDSIAAILEPFQERRAQLVHQDDYVRDVLHDGGKRARAIFAATLKVVRERMGLVIY